MLVNYTVQLTLGDSTANYDIYYDAINPSNYATLILGGNATGVTYNSLVSGVGIRVPDTSIYIIIRSNGVCDNDTIIPISPVIPPEPSPNLCMTFTEEKTLQSWLFTPNGTQNNKPKWTYTTYNIVWNPAIPANSGGPNGRWEMSLNSNVLFTTTNTSNIPDSGWYPTGLNASTVQNIQVFQGSCPAVSNLSAKITPSNTTCYQSRPCDGSVIILPSGGVSPYTYSVDGITFQTSNIIQSLCEGNYIVTTKDSLGNTTTNNLSIGYNATPTIYSVSIVPTNFRTVISTQLQQVQVTEWVLFINTPIPVGTTLSFSIDINTLQSVSTPGDGETTGTTLVYQNNTLLTPSGNNIVSNVQPRTLCSNESVSTTAITETYNLLVTNGDVVSGVSTSQLTITNFQVDQGTSCSTKLEQEITTYIYTYKNPILGCRCCSFNIEKQNQQLIYQQIGEWNP